jgi:predicted Rossmann fold nucleotide-binding protein DprA/Smf involved in DNA uptake
MRGVHSLLPHIPYWLVKVSALVGGVGVLIQWGGKLLLQLLEKYHLSYDEPVWTILRDNPKFKHTGTSNNQPMYDRTIDAPFSAGELAQQLHRFKWRVSASLRRLEKRGKIKEVSGGWVRKDK